MRIEVTEEDIKYGVQGSIHSCPLALAAQRAVGVSRSELYVGCHSIEIRSRKGVGSATLPLVARDFQDRFDQGLVIKPFSFEILLDL